MFRGKESSNRIELSQLVQDLLNFGDLGSLQLWVGGGWGWGMFPTHVNMYVHAHTCTHAHAHTCMCGKHDNFMQMTTPIGGIPGIPYDVIHMCMCMHMHVHMYGGTLSPPPPNPPIPHPQGDPQNQSKFIALELIEIFQFCLKI